MSTPSSASNAARDVANVAVKHTAMTGGEGKSMGTTSETGVWKRRGTSGMCLLARLCLARL